MPAGPAGVVAVMDVAEFTEKLAAGRFPNFTAVAPVKLDPEIATATPPTSGPRFGLTLVTTGGKL
jgi:hypothetical protein